MSPVSFVVESPPHGDGKRRATADIPSDIPVFFVPQAGRYQSRAFIELGWSDVLAIAPGYARMVSIKAGSEVVANRLRERSLHCAILRPRKGSWTVGILANQMWTFDGGNAINKSFVQPWVTYQLQGN